MNLNQFILVQHFICNEDRFVWTLNPIVDIWRRWWSFCSPVLLIKSLVLISVMQRSTRNVYYWHLIFAINKIFTQLLIPIVGTKTFLYNWCSKLLRKFILKTSSTKHLVDKVFKKNPFYHTIFDIYSAKKILHSHRVDL